MCAIVVANGTVEIVEAANAVISLGSSEIAGFHAVLDEAIELAEADLREFA